MFWLFSFSFAFLPFALGVANFEVGIVTLNPYIVGMCLVVLFGAVRWVLRMQPSFVSIYDIFIFLLASAYMVSTFLAKDMIGAGFLAFHALFVPIVSYFAVRIGIQNDKQYKTALIIFIISVALFSLYFISTFFTDESRNKVLEMPPIGVATVTVAALILAFNMKEKRFVQLTGLVILLALFLTFSRAYILSLVISPVIWYFVKRGYSNIIVIAFILITLVLTISISFDPELFRPTSFDKSVEFSVDRLTDTNFFLGTLYGRAIAYREGIDGFLSSPVFGMGLFKGEHMVTQHNFHIEWLQYGGVIGYLLYALVIIIHAIRMRHYAQKDNWISANIVIMILVLTNSVTNGLMHGVMPYVLFLIMGLNEARLKIVEKLSVTTVADIQGDAVKNGMLLHEKPGPPRILRRAK